MKKKMIIGALILGIALWLGYNYVYQEARDIAKETPEYIISSTELKTELNNNVENVVTKYLDKTIEVSGMVTDINNDFLILNGYITAQLSKQNNMLNLNDNIVIKGRFIGYDELLEELKLDQCTIINKQ